MIKCLKCKSVRNEIESPDCPVCKYGKPHNEPKNQFFKIGLGRGGGPKPKIKICPKCQFKGFAVRNKSGRMCMCGGCGRRVF